VLPILLSYNERVLPLVAGRSRCTESSPSGAPDGESATRTPVYRRDCDRRTNNA